jgi:polysaccharide biosynthesis protein PslG
VNPRPRPRRRAIALGAAAALVAVAAGLVVALTGGGSAPPATPTTAPQRTFPAQPPPATEQFGANVGRLFNDRAYSAAQIDAQLTALRATGATVARADALWEAAEPSPPAGGVHRYDWAFDDLIAGALAGHGLQWLPIVDYSAPWAQSTPGQDHSPPSSAADFADYARALAQRYGPGGAFWTAHPNLSPQPTDAYEVWNEPDNPVFWYPAPDPVAYANLYLQTRAAIEAVQPEARVLVGGLTHPASFLPAMLEAAPVRAGQLDGVAIHPYGPTPQAVLDNVRTARATLAARGLDRVPLYVTEFGWTTHPPGALDYLPERLRPIYIERTLVALGHLDCGVAAALLYAWMTPERDPANPQDWFGISPPGGGSSPDTVAFASALRAAGAPAATTALCAAP